MNTPNDDAGRLERRVSGVTAPAEGVAKKHFCRFWLSYMARPRRRRPNRQWRSNTRRLAWALGYVGDIGGPGLPGIPFEGRAKRRVRSTTTFPKRRGHPQSFWSTAMSKSKPVFELTHPNAAQGFLIKISLAKASIPRLRENPQIHRWRLGSFSASFYGSVRWRGRATGPSLGLGCPPSF